ncbi:MULTISPECIES: hypothetical protein [Tenebrionibacter/Tenebrionicola group]|uniref:Uncharacterized protein n=2 Tax=Tenebrionibacter/Tenebrionicola group TaxID=2969848 RepID=A0A8K0UZX5_9ENTR|nr:MULTISPECIES: hypothetical protein [Tenebrionibacter/Tenebrionicola group]MBK4714624.1 hypothetical protein [Tenebrionibacter intestinalis]MBV5095078.1 hypothetical protein [Tenebrionicola larvae]
MNVSLLADVLYAVGKFTLRQRIVGGNSGLFAWLPLFDKGQNAFSVLSKSSEK